MDVLLVVLAVLFGYTLVASIIGALCIVLCIGIDGCGGYFYAGIISVLWPLGIWIFLGITLSRKFTDIA